MEGDRLMELVRSLFAVLLLTSALSLNGCAAFRASTREVDIETAKPMDEKFAFTDMRAVTENLANDLLSSPFLSARNEQPVMMIAGIENRSEQYVDTKNLTDRLRTLLLNSGRVRFINEARRDDLMKEQGYQAANVTPADRLAIGQQLGADYMVSGSLTEMKSQTPRQVRVSKTKLSYYKVTFEVTNLQTGEILYIAEEEFAREARRPLIGW
jgi:penicillin-binding protein activator